MTLPGMRPDILARRDEHVLLIDVNVTHPCGEEQLRRIREQRRATIEIGMSQVARHASEGEIEEAIISTSPREWLFSARYERCGRAGTVGTEAAGGRGGRQKTEAVPAPGGAACWRRGAPSR